MKRTKQSLLFSIISLLLCFSMLLGTTYAWFTDSVASAGNRIVSGNLKVDLLHQTLDAQTGSSEWVSLKKNPDHKIFNYDKWEPGYTRFEKLKVANVGKLALRYELSATSVAGTMSLGANGESLADVIDVYLYNGESTAASFSEIKQSGQWILAGTLSEMLNATTDGFARGNVLPAGAAPVADAAIGEQVISIALHMKEEAGNEYQNLSLGDLHVTLLATQLANEFDSFGNQYDKNSVFPTAKINYSINSPVTLNADNTTAQEVSLGGTEDSIKATVPAGAKLDAGTSYVTLSVTELLNTNSNITVESDQATRSVDVHVSGVAEDNTAPIIVTVNALMPAGYNVGNFELYHIENGTPVLMTGVTADQLDAHNEYYYDAATGNVKMALCSFSEVAVVADDHPEWNGYTDHSWYLDAKADSNGNAPGHVSNPYIIVSADQLNSFAQIVGGMAVDANGNAIARDDFDKEYVKITRDIDLGTEEGHTKMDESGLPYRDGKQLVFYPIGYYFTDDKNGDGTLDDHYSTVYSFGGSFDGNGHTISNFYQNTWEMVGDNEYYPVSEHRYRDGMGLFGYVYDAEVKNLTIDNFKSDGEFTPTGCVAAYAHAADFINISVTNCNPRVYNTGNGGIVGIGGLSDPEPTARKAIKFQNITVDQTNKITALWGSWDVSCSGLMGMLRGPSDVSKWMKVEIDNCHVAAQIDAYNDVCGNYQYYWYRYSGMLVGSIRTHTTDANGYTIPDLSMIKCTDTTVYFGDWNNYYYCELVANSLASYTHDHQFSRLTEVKSFDVPNKTYVTLDGETKTVPETGSYHYVYLLDPSKGHSTENAFCVHFVDGERYLHSSRGKEEVDTDGDGVKETVMVEDKQHVYLPFNKQLFQGYGWGVKNIPIEEAQLKAFETQFNTTLDITVLDTTEGYSVEKFQPRDGIEFLAIGYTMRLGDIFDEIDNISLPINSTNVKIDISKVGATDNSFNYYNVAYTDENGDRFENWEDIRIRFINWNGAGRYILTIQDYYYCTATSIEVEVGRFKYNNGQDTVYIWTDPELNAPNANYSPYVANMTEAYAKLAQLNATSGRSGGRIVVIGNYTQNTIFRTPEHKGNITVTSIDDASTYWIDERQNNVGVRYICGGPTTFDDLRVEATKTSNTTGEDGTSKLSWNVVGNFHDLTITESVTVDRKGNDFIIVLGHQGGGVYGSTKKLEVKDATLTVNGGTWSEVVGTVRTSFESSNEAGTGAVDHLSQFINNQYHLNINIGGNASVDKVFGHSRSMEEELFEVLQAGNLGTNASCAISLLGGKVTRFFALNHLQECNSGYQRGFTVYIGKNFDIAGSFTDAPAQTANNVSRGSYVVQGLSGESVYKYAGETAGINIPDVSVSTGIDSDLLIGCSNLLVEYVEGEDRLNAVKENAKIRTYTFDHIEYGYPVEPQPFTDDKDVFFVGWTGTGDGKTADTFMNSVGWKTGLLINKPSNGDEGDYGENTDETTSTEGTGEKYPMESHLWYYFDNYGGTYVAKQKMYVGGSTAIKDAPTPLTFTAVHDGVDYRTSGTAEYGYFIIACAPIGTAADGTAQEADPYYVRIANSEVIFENITIFNRAGYELKEGFGVDTVIDSKTPYFIVDKNGKLVIKETVEFAAKLSGRENVYVEVREGGTLYLETMGFSSYTGAGTIVLSDELIIELNKDENGIERLNQLRAFTDQGGTICDERGITLKIHKHTNGARLIFNYDGGIPNMVDGKLEYIHKVYVADNGIGNGSSAAYPLNLLTPAYTALGTSGGIVELCDDFTFSGYTFEEPAHSKPITVLQTSGKFGVDGTHNSYTYRLNGDTTFENVHFLSEMRDAKDGRGIILAAQYHRIELKNCKVEGYTVASQFNGSFTVVGGFDAMDAAAANAAQANTNNYSNIVINGIEAVNGSRGVAIVGLDRYVNRTSTTDANITINSGDIHRIYGSTDQGTPKGKINITINGGNFHLAGGFTLNSKTTVDSIVLDINGGTFYATNEIKCLANKTTVHIASTVDKSTLTFANNPTIIDD